MIKLRIEGYCEDCPYFEAECYSTDVYADQECYEKDIVICCKKHRVCKLIENYIRKRIEKENV